jgi:thiosulfate dehydrogenase
MRTIKIMTLIACLLSAVTLYPAAAQQPLPQHPAAPGDGKSMVLQLCDGETNLVLPGVDPSSRLSPEQARVAVDKLMDLWYAKEDAQVVAAWKAETTAALQQRPQAPTKKAPAASKKTNEEQVADFSPRDYDLWQKEVAREVAYGDQIFHSDELVGSNNGVACAMCHPNGANTHPETYPKFQIQLRRVALLRDMINWCIENPSRGKKLDPDDPKMRALEAYILAQRKGVPMEYGKH